LINQLGLNFDFSYLDVSLFFLTESIFDHNLDNKHLNLIFIFNLFCVVMFVGLFILFSIVVLDSTLVNIFGSNYSLFNSYFFYIFDVNEEVQDLDDYFYFFLNIALFLFSYFYYCCFFSNVIGEINIYLTVFVLMMLNSFLMLLLLFIINSNNSITGIRGASRTSFSFYECFLDYLYVFISIFRNLLQCIRFIIIFCFFVDFYEYCDE
jgi:hypothetical protein